MPSVAPDLPTGFDVIVVGGGGSGLAAACTAADAGARVALLEKCSRLGGTTALSIGSISAPLTLRQQQRGVVDDIDSFVEDMLKFTGSLAARDNPALRMLMGREAPATVAWLQSLGVAFVGPFLEPPHRRPRMHNVVPGSHAYIAALGRHARSAGTSILTEARVTELLRDGGPIIGVRVSLDDGTASTLRAHRGVILATGDFASSAELKSRYIDPRAAGVRAANPNNTGDGHLLAEQVGGQFVNMDITDGPQLRFVPPKPSLLDQIPFHPVLSRAIAYVGNRLPPAVLRLFAKQLLTAWMAPSPEFLTGGPVLVTRAGRRVEQGEERLAYALAEQGDGEGFLILDRETTRRFSRGGQHISTAPGVAYAYWQDYQRGRRDLITRARSPRELAQALAIEPKGLEHTLQSMSGPLYAMGPIVSLFTTTEGGLRINERCQVLAADGTAIPGLWAAGAVGQSGLILDGHGLHILWAMTSGRISGREAAAASPRW